MSAKFNPQSEYFELLKTWCDGLIRYQIDMPDFPEFDGGISCPSCKMIHGRCHDAIYPMMTLFSLTGDEKYLNSAKKLFKWGANMFCDDGSLYNDAHSVWNGITVFNAIGLHDALFNHASLLDDDTRAQWEDRLGKMGSWLYHHLVPGMRTNINYFCTNACAMALLGNYFHNEEYLALAKSLAKMAIDHLSVNGLLFGEGQPNESHTVKGCPAIDIGYNVEESMPSLIRYAEAAGDEEALDIFTKSYRAHLEVMLPDGAWDNSFGTRNFKWTYWGGRTSDGCQEVMNYLGKKDPMYAEAGYRNFKLYKEFTHDGLLFGGRDYKAHGEYPCTHHAFCHAKVLAAVLDNGVCEFERTEIPSDHPDKAKYYPELDMWRVAVGDWRADISAYDFNYMRGGHTSGGSMSLLWNRKYGPVIAVGAVDYTLHEPHNQQLSLKKAEHLSAAPRIEAVVDGVRYGQHYDFTAKMSGRTADGKVFIHTDAHLADDRQSVLENGVCTLDYVFEEDKVTISGRMPAGFDGISYKLPVVCSEASVTVAQGTLSGEPIKMFNLNPGFICREYNVLPDEKGEFTVVIA